MQATARANWTDNLPSGIRAEITADGSAPLPGAGPQNGGRGGRVVLHTGVPTDAGNGSDGDVVGGRLELDAGKHQFRQIVRASSSSTDVPVLVIRGHVVIQCQYIFDAVIEADFEAGDPQLEIYAGQPFWIDPPRDLFPPPPGFQVPNVLPWYHSIRASLSPGDALPARGGGSLTFHTSHRGPAQITVTARGGAGVEGGDGGSGGVVEILANPPIEVDQAPRPGPGVALDFGRTVVIGSIDVSGGIGSSASGRPGGNGGSGGQIAVLAESFASPLIMAVIPRLLLEVSARGGKGGNGSDALGNAMRGGNGAPGGAIRIQSAVASALPIEARIDGGDGGHGGRSAQGRGGAGGNAAPPGRCVGTPLISVPVDGLPGLGGTGPAGRGADGTVRQVEPVSLPVELGRKNFEWTIMVYAAADDGVQGLNDVESTLVHRLFELESLRRNPSVQVLFQIDRHPEHGTNGPLSAPVEADWGSDWFDSRRGWLLPRNATWDYLTKPHLLFRDFRGFYSYPISTRPGLAEFNSSSAEGNTGSPSELSTFVKWCKSAAPANRYILMLAGHGAGWVGFLQDRENGNEILSRLTLTGLREALSEIGPLDLLVIPACSMSCVELATEIQGVAPRFVVAAENFQGNTIVNPEWMELLNRGEDDAFTIAARMVESTREGVWAVIDLVALPRLLSAIREYSQAYTTVADSTVRLREVQIFAAISRREPDFTARNRHVDLGTLFANLAREHETAQLRTAAAGVRDAAKACTPVSKYDISIWGMISTIFVGPPWFAPADHTGLSIHAPLSTDKLTPYETAAPSFKQTTEWSAFVRSTLAAIGSTAPTAAISGSVSLAVAPYPTRVAPGTPVGIRLLVSNPSSDPITLTGIAANGELSASSAGFVLWPIEVEPRSTISLQMIAIADTQGTMTNDLQIDTSAGGALRTSIVLESNPAATAEQPKISTDGVTLLLDSSIPLDFLRLRNPSTATLTFRVGTTSDFAVNPVAGTVESGTEVLVKVQPALHLQGQGRATLTVDDGAGGVLEVPIEWKFSGTRPSHATPEPTDSDENAADEGTAPLAIGAGVCPGASLAIALIPLCIAIGRGRTKRC